MTGKMPELTRNAKTGHGRQVDASDEIMRRKIREVIDDSSADIDADTFLSGWKAGMPNG
ncbi:MULTISPECIES: hypothetical protein [Rhizobium]|uniref:Uncharacterized protein n=1 Tax=Rhizobium phaseoli TaxID=396 RepID=A0A192T4W9_9HYPH|nr:MULTISPECIES: hypothetical protein [Rhizobium]ANL39493.1 hypothetical protein AMC88_CH01063 [Rhizobium phaseoli]ANL52226.1 hypothetical protein AMC86_CH01043 [Rhizobium phaseoli]ANL58482.1 hypothetical protein AMC85_CH01063 [Rhizobium phaseoli]ANL83840.1 hypothetical protein AMC81_CH01026 [Rhizobium phaseoli]ANL90348.1 hypothetical protein AMC80_CH01026 [Rhizobium phaseoli]